MYEQYFNFTQRPFKLSPDPRFIFLSPQHKKAISYLEYGLSLGEGFIVITGPIGSGKTTLSENLLNNVGNDIEAIKIVTPNLSPLDLLIMIASKFGLMVGQHSQSEIITAIEAYLHTLQQRGKRALLVVDEAQNLPPETIEELRMLSNLTHNQQPLIQSFLLGQEELEGIIALPNMEQFRQRIIAACHLKALSPSQTGQYILHRLSVVGWKGIPKLDPAIFDTVCDHAKGIPRRINLLMDRVFLASFLSERNVITVSDVQEVIDDLSAEFTVEKPEQAEPKVEPISMKSPKLAQKYWVKRLNGV